MDLLFDYHFWASLGALTALEVVLGIDNVVFISLIANHLAPDQRRQARLVGLGLALLMRIALLFGAVWMLGLEANLFTFFGFDLSGKDLLLLGGGLFLLAQGTSSMHEEVTGELKTSYTKYGGGFAMTVAQIVLIDFVFSFDSVITAIGITPLIWVIVIAMCIAMGVMIWSASYIARFIETHPTLKMLALAFVIMIGVFLAAEGLGFHVPKGYIYFGMAFALAIESLNMLRRRNIAK